MKSLAYQELETNPFFDLETYMLLSGVKRMDGEKARQLETDWNRFKDYLRAYRLGDKKGYLLIYLDENFEQELDSIQEKDPDHGENLTILAQTMIMSLMQDLLPEAGTSGCAPLPEPNKILKRSLAKLDLEYSNAGNLSRKFAVITPLPYTGGCEQCFKKGSCLKRNMLNSN